jgi:ABC-type nitrate/sulfonate/bicarbonate transport system substrate-binding protein
MSRRLAAAVALFLLAPAPEPLRLALLNRTATNWAIYAGVAHGDFAREGVDLRVTVAGASAAMTAQLLDGSADIGHMAAGNVVEAAIAGRDLTIVMAVNRPLFTLIASPGVTSLAALGGKDVGVDNGRTGYVHLVRALLRRAGVADGDIRISDVGGVDARYTALMAGQVQAALLSPPRDLQAIAQGYLHLADIEQTPDTYTGSVAVVRREWAERHHDVLVAYLRAYRRALTWLYDAGHEAEAVKILSANVDVPESLGRQIYRQTILEKGWLLRDGDVHPSGIAAVAAEMDGGKNLSMSSYLDMRYYKESAK